MKTIEIMKSYTDYVMVQTRKSSDELEMVNHPSQSGVKVVGSNELSSIGDYFTKHELTWFIDLSLFIPKSQQELSMSFADALGS